MRVGELLEVIQELIPGDYPDDRVPERRHRGAPRAVAERGHLPHHVPADHDAQQGGSPVLQAGRDLDHGLAQQDHMSRAVLLPDQDVTTGDHALDAQLEKGGPGLIGQHRGQASGRP
jgi:hypothetical protein